MRRSVSTDDGLLFSLLFPIGCLLYMPFCFSYFFAVVFVFLLCYLCGCLYVSLSLSISPHHHTPPHTHTHSLSLMPYFVLLWLVIGIEWSPEVAFPKKRGIPWNPCAMDSGRISVVVKCGNQEGWLQKVRIRVRVRVRVRVIGLGL